ncbi:hypothetical protein FEM48_Zijuj08G0047800 [Ziziphus jujuba var. spinosa]|uniref:Uncharacterized protein n=1 Tax=Ziziphus jujuba var. spinosa TaxID=714518 RepID=A0A978UX23_ZIZJJ|nr:hypothetical protein FEM48_Zijuj08G0047800 [Ziziphus jujuba var. spinosa]
MGNKLGRRKQVIDEKYTRPQGLYHHKDVDHKKLRKLILESKLAPCYPGDEECTCDLEECPICFLEEQRVIEAKIRMRKQELQEDEERLLKRQELNSSSRNMAPVDVEYSSPNVLSSTSHVEGEEIISSQDSCSASMFRSPPSPRVNRDDEFDMDLEDIMVMEAIWLSIQKEFILFKLYTSTLLIHAQISNPSSCPKPSAPTQNPILLYVENGRQRTPTYVDAASSEQYVTEDRYVSPAIAPVVGSSSLSSPSGGLACAIAALAERQQMGGESSSNPDGNGSAFNMVPGTSRFYNRVDGEVENYPPAVSSTDVSPNGQMASTRDDREWNVDHGSEVAEAGTSYAGSDAAEDGSSISALPPSDQVEDSLQNVPEPIIPESFEEQMMLAMAVSLAEAQAMTSGPGVSWQ